MKTKQAKIITIAVSIIVIAVALYMIIFGSILLSNKWFATDYDSLGDTDKKMLEIVNSYITGDGTAVKNFDMPIAFVRDGGLARGKAFVFNMHVTEGKYAFGLAGGTFATQIMLPDSFDELGTMYRCSIAGPGIGSFFFPDDRETDVVNGEQVIVIHYNAKSIEDGTFKTLLENAI